METSTMFDAQPANTATRPLRCPFCHGSRFDTLAKVITPATCWRCRECDKTWTIATTSVAKPFAGG
jgi:transposase-like protein